MKKIKLSTVILASAITIVIGIIMAGAAAMAPKTITDCPLSNDRIEELLKIEELYEHDMYSDDAEAFDRVPALVQYESGYIIERELYSDVFSEGDTVSIYDGVILSGGHFGATNDTDNVILGVIVSMKQ